MNLMKFSIIHPTARVTHSFEHVWWKAFASALRACDDPKQCEYILVVHVSRIPDLEMPWCRANRIHTSLRGTGDVPPDSLFGRFTVVTNFDRDCLVDQCNAGQLAASGEILIGNQDDMRYPDHWDTRIAELIPDTSQKVCIQAHTDGWSRPDLLTIPSILTKALQDEIGALSTEYESMYLDDEWSLQARKLGTVIPAPHIRFQHMHPVVGSAKTDSIYELENRPEAYRVGREAFERRRALGFPRVPIQGERTNGNGSGILARAVSDLPPKRKMVACLPGEDHERMSCVLNLSGYLASRGFDFAAILGYSSGPDVTRTALTETAVSMFSKDPLAPYVLWMDDDNYLAPGSMARLLDFMEGHPEADLIVGWYWIRHGVRWSLSVGEFIETDGKVDQHVRWLELPEIFQRGESPRLIPRLAAGFGCVLMRREVLEKLGGEAFFKIPGQFRYGNLGEDISFFWRAHEAGLKCFLDPLCAVPHLKEQPLQPDLQVLQSSGNGRPADCSIWPSARAVPAGGLP